MSPLLGLVFQDMGAANLTGRQKVIAGSYAVTRHREEADALTSATVATAWVSPAAAPCEADAGAGHVTGSGCTAGGAVAGY